MGRPSSYTDEIGREICERMANGEGLRAICRSEHMPPKTTVMRWLLSDDHMAFRDQYGMAREMLMEHWAEDVIEISDDGTNDWMMRRQASGGGRSDAAGEAEVAVPNHEHINRSKLRVESRKWMMSKLAPKKYGDKLIHAGDAENPIAMVPVLNVYTNAVEALETKAIEHKPLNGANGNGKAHG